MQPNMPPACASVLSSLVRGADTRVLRLVSPSRLAVITKHFPVELEEERVNCFDTFYF